MSKFMAAILILLIAGIFIVLSILMLASLFLSDNDETLPLADDEILICHIKSIDGYRVIDRNKIVEYDPDTGYWIFTNGYAKNCYIEKE